MYAEFNTLPETSRVWVYQANRSFTEDEVAEIKEELKTFLEQWTVHGKDLRAGFDFPYNRFIVIALDQSMASASGCSIDASVHFIQHLEKQYQVDLLDKMNVSYKQGEFVAYKSLTDFKQMAKQKAVSGKTVVFNNLVNTKQEYEEFWEVPASESWHSRFM